MRGYIFAIFERAIGECPIDEAINPATRVFRSLKKTPVGAKQPALTDVPSLIQLQQDIDNSTSRVITKLASQSPCADNGLGPASSWVARWEEFDGIDWERPEVPVVDPTWRIPAARMKLSVEDKGNDGFGHDVPLTPQAIAVVRRYDSSRGFAISSSQTTGAGGSR